MTHSALRRAPRAALASATATALAIGGFLAAPAAHADISTTTPTAVTNAVFTWGLSDEAGGGAYNGSCNFLSAGIAGNAGSSRPWVAADGFYQTTAGNVSILKDGPDSSKVAPTWDTKCQTGAGAKVSAFNPTSKTGNVVQISNGTGTLNPDGSGRIAWDGDFTVAFYGGLTYWSASDPVLTVDAAGKGQLTATASGYGASQDGSSWAALPGQQITLATLSDVDVADAGFTATPDYRGVEANVGSGTAQARSGANWGAFPQSFIDFQQKTGQSSYWYSSGASRDAAKVAAPLTVTFDTAAVTPSVTVSKTTGLNPNGETVTVKGTGFLPNGTATSGTRPPLSGKFTGTYVIFGKFADAWKPSEAAVSSSRTAISQVWAVPAADLQTIGGASAGAIELQADGSFEAKLEVKTPKTEVAGNYGIYTYAGGGAKYAPFETFTPVSLAEAPAAISSQPASAKVAVTVAAPSVSHTFKVGVAGGPTPTVSWERRAAGSNAWIPLDNATGTSLARTLTTKDNGTAFRAVATNAFGTATSKEALVTVESRDATLSSAVPTISGQAKVGKTLSANSGTWAQNPSISYQWYANGASIKKATGRTYTLTANERGKAITVRVTGKKSGYTTLTRTSKATSKVATGTLSVATPKISGKAKVGRKLTIVRGSWTGGTSYSYQWYANGAKINRATSSSLTLKWAQRGKRITVKVTGKKSGYTTVTKTSKSTARVY